MTDVLCDMLGAIDQEEAAKLTSRLVAHRSYPGEEGPVQNAVADWLAAEGLAPAFQPTDDDDRPNVACLIENGEGPTFLLNGHVDTVLAVDGWSTDPWTAHRDGDRLYGLGACDMKSGVAATMLAARSLHRHRDAWRGTLLFTSVVDEEAYSSGARALIASGLRADYCLVAEASWAAPCIGSVGKALVRIDVTGKAAHASWPWDGVNAATEAARLVASLDELPIQTHPRMRGSRCVLGIQAGNEQYVITVPEKARIVVNRMLAPGETGSQELLAVVRLAESLDSPARFAVTVDPPFYPPWETPKGHPLAQSLARSYEREAGRPPEWGYTGFGDTNLFSGEAGIPTVMCGPLGGNFHQADEWVDVPSIASSARLMVRMVADLLAPATNEEH